MRNIIFIILLFLSSNSFAQTVLKVDNFSNDYYAKVEIDSIKEVFSKGWIAIYDKKTNRELIKVNSDELAFEDVNSIVNKSELPYGTQSLILYNDFNFDGIKDFAIEDGQNSCYHGSSYTIFLFDKKSFRFNKSFTRLAHDYCGMFDVDCDTKKIYTMSKSGCCFHDYSTFIVEKNKPKVIRIIEESSEFAFDTFTEKNWNGHKMVEKSERTINLNQEGIKSILSFTISNKNKKVILYNLNDRTLNYALVDSIGDVEFSFPIETVYKNPDFRLRVTKNKSTLIFTNKNTTYKIYETKDTNGNQIGIEVKIKDKTYDFQGYLKSKQGSLNDLLNVKLDNFTIEKKHM